MRVVVRRQEEEPGTHPEHYPRAFCDELELLIADAERTLKRVSGMETMTAETHGGLEDFERAREAVKDELSHLHSIHRDVCEP